MKIGPKQILPALLLVALSAFLYYLHYIFFGDIHHILIYLIGDIAFLPIDILLVSIVFHRILDNKEKKSRLKKLNMVIGTFFTETGTGLISLFLSQSDSQEKLAQNLKIDLSWKKSDFINSRKNLLSMDCSLHFNSGDYFRLKDFLLNKRDFLLKILENPIVMEHESFTDLMMSIFHLEEELSMRSDLQRLSKEDRNHLLIDSHRVVTNLYREWLLYLEHLKEDYPYLYSFAVRTNPFDPDAHVEFGEKPEFVE
ncbi:MAG: hypothetical protein HGA49_05765 [Eubacteriaceae bacterium]|nr:hypothetical protein [Eubacteriaceae bacterium]